MSILKVDYLVAIFFQVSYSLVLKIDFFFLKTYWTRIPQSSNCEIGKIDPYYPKVIQIRIKKDKK
jgi:hypothetical protein